MSRPPLLPGDIAFTAILASGAQVFLHHPFDGVRRATWTLDHGEPTELLRFDDPWSVRDGHLIVWVAIRDSLSIRPAEHDLGEIVSLTPTLPPAKETDRG